MTFTRDVLYQLKQLSIAIPIDVYKVNYGLTEIFTGTQVQGITKVAVKKALILPGHVSQFYRQLTSSQFRTGGEQNIESKVFVIDQVELGGYALKKTDYIVYLDKKYEIIDIDFTEAAESMMVLSKHLFGSPFVKSVDAKLRARANPTSTFTVVP